MNNRKINPGVLLITTLLAVCLFVGCGDSNEAAVEKTEAADETTTEAVKEVVAALTAAEQEMVETVAAISTALEKAPGMATSIIEKAGMTTAEYEAAVHEIAESPTLTEAYEKAKGN